MKPLFHATSLVGLALLCAGASGCSTEPPLSGSTVNKSESQTSATANAGDEAANRSPAASASGQPASNPTETNPVEAKTRRFTFHYRFKVKGLMPAESKPDSVARVWLPAATSSDEQDVERLEATTPGEVSENTESKFGNRVLFLETKIPESGEFTVDIPYQVTRREVLRGPSRTNVTMRPPLSDKQRDLFLKPDVMVPTTGKPLKLLDMVELLKDRIGMARQLYDVVDNHVTYKKDGTEWGRGDANWVCDSGFGNCTDFHSLFISLARSQGLPARFEIGFSIPTDKQQGPITGYHCWAWFYTDERGWVPVDISEADKNPAMKDYYFGGLTPDRVTFTVGRDLELVPKSESPPLNFFVYPHIEVGGKPLSKENIELQFAFEELT